MLHLFYWHSVCKVFVIRVLFMHFAKCSFLKWTTKLFACLNLFEQNGHLRWIRGPWTLFWCAFKFFFRSKYWLQWRHFSDPFYTKDTPVYKLIKHLSIHILFIFSKPLLVLFLSEMVDFFAISPWHPLFSRHTVCKVVVICIFYLCIWNNVLSWNELRSCSLVWIFSNKMDTCEEFEARERYFDAHLNSFFLWKICYDEDKYIPVVTTFYSLFISLVGQKKTTLLH